MKKKKKGRKSPSSAEKATPKQSAKEEGGLMMEDHASTFTSLPNSFFLYNLTVAPTLFEQDPTDVSLPRRRKEKNGSSWPIATLQQKRSFNEAPLLHPTHYLS